VMHHWLLCMLHTRGFFVSVGKVVTAELLIYVACVPLLLLRLSLRSLIAVFVAFGLMGLIALARGGYFDPKAARDLLIPLVFVWAGRSYAQGSRSLDRPLLAVTAVVVVIGLLEAVLPDLYSRAFNIFSYYTGLGGDSNAGQVAGQSVALNGLRPEGIGRTLLPQLLGAKRVSSVFLEPVSLGNFAVILMAYGLAKPWSEWRVMAWFAAASVLLIILADSRFGSSLLGLLVLLRLLVHGSAHVLAVTFPVIGACALLALATYAPGLGDNLVGRMTMSGRYLLSFDEMNLLGLRGFSTAFGDMGYAYVLSRFGLPGVVLMWLCLFMLPLRDETARRFRTSMSAYVTLILCVSGTSLFALKTAGVLWFVFGAMSMHRPKGESS
ncbi:MAG TPA: polysaccharide polymerase, partial [Rhizobacter sp.]|nr:polysaccharide polymerase [Rhizobacter sp.]